MSNLNIREIQILLKSLMNSNNSSENNVLLDLIDDAKETLLDMVFEGAKKEDILNAFLELLVIATLLNIDIESELNKLLYSYSGVYKIMS